ncbi:hypothetical protein [Nocardioides lianchengensis]|uniref:UDP-N-acetyl-alpha-D-muramoyl-L-alanyl-L-glutamate epimerase n=1 Tax=Nocardioides lianchengensis TaxID=1045774 RepID=A0A1G6XU49_9ACTN|nr:hypothetical protein [Nocardioides lianchengensis]NYG13442.1 hypothetical protein [Nocardioides lianchengensis]SDD81734.1 hypothetical protein SAMN05421872_11189 [Nocardioides lianchengensis]
MSQAARQRGRVFSYERFELTADGVLTCTYSLDDETFTEVFAFEAGDDADFTSPAVLGAARVLFLLAGISYYKTGAPPLLVGPADGLSPREADFLRDVHLHGLAEFSYRSGVDISDLRIEAGPRTPAPAAAVVRRGPLVPFGGGIDSIVVVDGTTAGRDGAALFVANTSDVPFEPIEDSAAITGLPVRRVRRHLDPKVLESKARGYLNGHVPVTGVISAAAVVSAVAHGHDRVVMSNEHSASEPTGLVANGVPVNHQWSKGLDFERAFRAVLAENVTGVDYYSALRPFSELWVAERFAELTDYHLAFRSCNKAFFVDAGSRHPTWCGRCDKCCFIDLILSPYVAPAELDAIFRGHEPLRDESLAPVFESLLGQPGSDKPLECVGDEGECRTAVTLAVARPDRADTPLLAALAAHVATLEQAGKPVPSEQALLHRQGEHFLPADDGR